MVSSRAQVKMDASPHLPSSHACALQAGLEVNSTGETVGTFALAYAAHKALSPVRFPPTVALTPVVAKWLARDGGREGEDTK